MNFEFSDEQRLLQDSVQRLLADRYGFEARLKAADSEEGFSHTMWNSFAELGLTALPFAEEDGGIGGGSEDIMIVMEAFGRSLTLEPFLSSVVIPATVFRHNATRQQAADIVPLIAEGSLRLALAHQEASGGYRLSHVTTTAVPDKNGYRLHGQKTLVLHGGSADRLIVSARLDGKADESSGIGLFLVDASSEGVSRQSYATQDGMQAAEVILDQVFVPANSLLGGHHEAYDTIRRVADECIAALCSEAVGAMDQALKLTVEYLKTRKQFGRAIGEFQVLQHKAAEMVVELEQARSMAMYATMMARSDNPVERAKATSAAKVQIGRSAKFIGEACVQLHGGVGMTMEYQIGHYFKRLTMIEKAFGNTDFHMDQLAGAGSLFE